MNKKSTQFKRFALATLAFSSLAISACDVKDKSEEAATTNNNEALEQVAEPMVDNETPEVMQSEEVPTDAQIAAEQQTEQADAATSNTQQDGDITQAEADAAAEALAAADEVQ